MKDPHRDLGLLRRLLRLGQERGELEHLPSALAVALSHDGRVDVEEAVLLEEAMGRVGEAVSDARNTGDGVGARAAAK